MIAHGGPHANALNSSDLVRLMLLQGYSLLFINFSGSLGEGQELVEQRLGEPGTKEAEEFKCLIESALGSNRL